MALTSKQIYTVVNAVAQQAMGSSALAVVDNTGLIALGNTVLSDNGLKNNFISALTDRIGRTIVSFRAYHSHFPDFERDAMEWGNILQKLKVAMPQAEQDQAYDLADGGTVDMFKISKPKAVQKLFTSQTPWQTHITIHDYMLEDAFLGATQMGSFLSGIFGEVQNFIELETETMAMDCINNYIAELHAKTTGGASPREIKLITEYTEIDPEGGAALAKKPEEALYDSNFLMFAVRRINKISATMERMLYGAYNDTTGDTQKAFTRHTPKDMQRLILNIDLDNALKTNLYSKSFNKSDTVIDLDYQTVPFWQNPQSPDGIHVKRASDGTDTTVPLVMGVLFDREAMGTFKNKFKSSTTPINSAGMYYNVYYHMIKMYFNDLSENGVSFVLA